VHKYRGFSGEHPRSPPRSQYADDNLSPTGLPETIEGKEIFTSTHPENNVYEDLVPAISIDRDIRLDLVRIFPIYLIKNVDAGYSG
jgi:hypothetical protein